MAINNYDDVNPTGHLYIAFSEMNFEIEASFKSKIDRMIEDHLGALFGGNEGEERGEQEEEGGQEVELEKELEAMTELQQVNINSAVKASRAYNVLL